MKGKRRSALTAAFAILLGAALAWYGMRELRPKLTPAAADRPSGGRPESLLDSFNSAGLTPLMIAAREDDAEAISGLLTAGAGIERVDRRNGWTPLLHAIHKGSRRAVAALLAGGAEPNHAPVASVPPLFYALEGGDVAIVRQLLDAGADPRASLRGGVNTLLIAVEGGFLADVDRSRRLLGGCNDASVRLLFERAPDLRLPSGAEARLARLLARWHGCRETLALLATHEAK